MEENLVEPSSISSRRHSILPPLPDYITLLVSPSLYLPDQTGPDVLINNKVTSFDLGLGPYKVRPNICNDLILAVGLRICSNSVQAKSLNTSSAELYI